MEVHVYNIHHNHRLATYIPIKLDWISCKLQMITRKYSVVISASEIGHQISWNWIMWPTTKTDTNNSTYPPAIITSQKMHFWLVKTTARFESLKMRLNKNTALSKMLFYQVKFK